MGNIKIIKGVFDTKLELKHAGIKAGFSSPAELSKPYDKSARRRRTDEEICQLLVSKFGLRKVQDVLLLSRERQKDVIRIAREYGASIRQLERLTGISFSIICRN